MKKNLQLLFIITGEPTLTTVSSTCINTKEKEKKKKQMREAKKRKGFEAHRVKHPTPSWAINALIGNEEPNGKQEEKKKETGSGSQTRLPWIIQSLPMMHRDHRLRLFF